MLRFETGEELLETLAQFSQDHGLRAAAVMMGIGQLRTATLAYWNGQEYEAQEIRGPTELVSLAGSVAVADGRPSVHLHASLGLRNQATLSGHVIHASVGVLLEVRLDAFPAHGFSRPMDEGLGLRTLRLDPEAPDGRPRPGAASSAR